MTNIDGCAFCNGEKGNHTISEYGDSLEIAIRKLIPMPGVNLTTGEIIEPSGGPFYELTAFDEKTEVSAWPIQYCPMCGRRLE